MRLTHGRWFPYPRWTDPDQPPPTRSAMLDRKRGPRPPGGATCAACGVRARNCECPDGPDIE